MAKAIEELIDSIEARFAHDLVFFKACSHIVPGRVASPTEASVSAKVIVELIGELFFWSKLPPLKR